MSEGKIVLVKVLSGGPYLVSGSPPLADEIMVLGGDGEPERWVQGSAIPAGRSYTLCRCGQTKTAPFCDGAHSRAAFEGTESAPRRNASEMAEKTEGPSLDLIDVACYCAIARFCHRAGDAWILTEQSNDPEKRIIAVESACNCPSGRLTAWDKAADRPIEPELAPSIGVIQDTRHKGLGPLWLKGGIPIEAADGYRYEVRNRMTLCRCGHSGGKPFCDGTHVRIRFGTAAAGGAKP